MKNDKVFWIFIFFLLTFFVFLGFVTAPHGETFYWNSIIAGVMITGLSISTYFNQKILGVSEYNHKENLNYQAKISLFEKRKQLIDKLSSPKEFIDRIIKIPVVHYNNEMLTIQNTMARNMEHSDYANITLDTDALIDIQDTARKIYNDLTLLFDVEISNRF